MTKIVLNSSYSEPFNDKIIQWFKNHGVELPSDASEEFFERHDSLLVQCVEENQNELNYLEIREIKGNIYRINYDFEYDCEFLEEPDKESGWICVGNDSTLSTREINATCRGESDCPFCMDDNDEKTIPFNQKWCEHCGRNSKSRFLKIKEIQRGEGHESS